MKKILLFLAVLVVLAVMAAAFFIATFDANKHKSKIESEASKALGSEVRIGSIDLRFHGGVAVGIQKFEVYEKGLTAPSLSVEVAEVSLKLLPLLKKSIEISSVRIVRPRITLVREESAIKVLGVNLPATESKGATGAPSKPSPGASPLAFLIKEVKISDGEINYRDVTVKPASHIAVKHLDVTVKNVSLAGPVKFVAEAAVFGEQRNVRASGEAANLAGGTPELRNLAASVDLGLIDFAALEKGVPAIQQAGLQRELAGKVDVSAGQILMGAKGLEKFDAKIKMTDGRFGLQAVKPFFEKIQIDAEADQNTARLNGLSLQFSGGSVTAKATARDYMRAPQSEADVSVRSIRIDPLVPLTSKGKPLVEGAMSFAFKGTAVGTAWPQISETLNGRATIEFEKGILLNLNIVRELLGKLTMFPGLVENLEKSLPEAYRPKLTHQSTLLNPMTHAFDIKDGTVLIRDLNASTDFFVAHLDADARLSGSLDGHGSVKLDKTFSKAMLQGFPETEFLASGASEIELPLIIKYDDGGLVVLPDLKQVVKNLTGGGGQALLAGLLGQKSAATQAPAASAAQPTGAAQAEPSQQEKVLGWLNQIKNAAQSTKESEPAASAGSTS